MLEWFLNFEYWLYTKCGYNFVVHLEDFLLCTASIFIGSIITYILCGKVLLKLHKIPIQPDGKHHKKIKWVLLNDDNKNEFVVEPENLGEAVETILVITFKPLLTYKHYGFRDERRTKIFIFCFLSIGILLIIFAFLSIVTVFDPK